MTLLKKINKKEKFFVCNIIDVRKMAGIIIKELKNSAN